MRKLKINSRMNLQSVKLTKYLIHYQPMLIGERWTLLLLCSKISLGTGVAILKSQIILFLVDTSLKAHFLPICVKKAKYLKNS